MSAWTVTTAHISALVNAGLEHGLVDKKSTVNELNTFGQMLWDENYASVNARYGESEEVPCFSFEATEASLDPSAVQMLAACYDYQSCEHAGWDNSVARLFTQALRERCAADPRYTGEFKNTYGPGGVSMWGINTLAEVPTVPELQRADG